MTQFSKMESASVEITAACGHPVEVRFPVGTSDVAKNAAVVGVKLALCSFCEAAGVSLKCPHCSTVGAHHCFNDVDINDLCQHGQEWGECCDGLGVPQHREPLVILSAIRERVEAGLRIYATVPTAAAFLWTMPALEILVAELEASLTAQNSLAARRGIPDGKL